MQRTSLFILFSILLKCEGFSIGKFKFGTANFSNKSMKISAKIVTTKVVRHKGYWSEENIAEAMKNPLGETAVNRRKRETFWTENRLNSATPLDALSHDSISSLGVSEDFFTNYDDVEPGHIEAANLNEFPYGNFGKLFVKTDSGNGHCTAAFVRDKILLTAAHCARNAAGWFEEFTFYHNYNGMEDAGREFEVEKSFIYDSFISEEGGIYWKYDYAFMTTKESFEGRSIDFDFSEISDDEVIYFAGYPGNFESGHKLAYSSGLRNPDIQNLIHVPSNPILSGGSGGAWMIIDADGVYNVIGVASHLRPEQNIPGSFSPFFDEETQQLLATAENEVTNEANSSEANEEEN